MKKYSLVTGAIVALLPLTAFAQEVGKVSTGSQWALALAVLGAAMATLLPCFGSTMAVSMVGQAGNGILTEKPELAGRVITLTVIPGSQGLYGMVISLLFLFTYGPSILNGTLQLTVAQGLAFLIAFLPVTITCLTSASYQAKVCTTGLNLLAKDAALTGRVITLAALVETYALLGFLISFFMLNALQAGFAA